MTNESVTKRDKLRHSILMAAQKQGTKVPPMLLIVLNSISESSVDEYIEVIKSVITEYEREG